MKRASDADWAEARRLCRLSASDVRMAKELGMSPRTLIRNRPSHDRRHRRHARHRLGRDKFRFGRRNKRWSSNEYYSNACVAFANWNQ